MSPSIWEGNALGYSTVESLLEEVSKNMAASNLSRYNHRLSGQRTSGSKIVKPGSASNSPRNSVGLGRRMTDGAYRRRLAMMDPNTLGSGPSFQNDTVQTPSQRPVSWHPATHIQQEAPYQTGYPTAYAQLDTFNAFDFSIPQSSCSGYTSPSSTFSPLSAPYNGYEQQHYNIQGRPHSYHPTSYAVNPEHNTYQPLQQTVPSTSADMDPSMYSHFDFSNFNTNEFEDPTTPPTPDNFLPIQHPEPNFPAEEAIPYHPLDDSDDTGEELIGMGLYDNPDVSKSQSDPHLDNYRALMMSQLLGTPYRRPEPCGKGLKLEETWAPPPETEDADDEDDEDQDGEGEDDDVLTQEAVHVHEQEVPLSRNDALVNMEVMNSYAQPNLAMHNQGGWL